VRNRVVTVLLAATVLAAGLLTLVYQAPWLTGRRPSARPRAVVIFKTIDYAGTPFWGNVRDGVVSGGSDFGIDVSVRGPAVETDIQGQMEIVRRAMEENPAAIVLAAADYNLLVPLAREIKARGIRLVCVDSFINSDDADVRVGTDNTEGGQKCGTALLRLVSPGDTVAIMSYVKGSSTAIDRESGARRFLEGKVHLLDTLYSDSDEQTAYRQAAELIRRTPQLRGIVALNDPTVRGAARALAESGKADRIALVGFDASFPVLRYVERGVIRDTVVQKPFNMGYLAMRAVRDLLAGKHSAREVNTGSLDITRENMFLPENQKLLFPVASGS
jgi:ribose transport system substrate-binding protein